MSVLSYLCDRASDAVFSGLEQHSINRSTSLLEKRLAEQLGAKIEAQLRFGSSSRGTILPRKMDEESDIDHMVIFNDRGLAPQTYLDRLRRFVDQNYPKSTIYQSTPTIVLELNHIKFDLVPAVNSFWSGLQIPNGKGSWQSTDPKGFNALLSRRNSECDGCLKPAIRLVKYWNAQNGYPFESFWLEQWIAKQYYPCCSNLRQYLFSIFRRLYDAIGNTPGRRRMLKSALNLIQGIEEAEKRDSKWAESQVQKLIYPRSQ